MKPLLKIVLALISISIIANLIIGAPSAKWDLIQPGMSQQEITTLLGRPSMDVFKSKGIQIWIRGGFIRSSSLAIFYYNQDTPDLATEVRQSDTWFRKAFGPPIMKTPTVNEMDSTPNPQKKD
jgi:hypothetical protein